MTRARDLGIPFEGEPGPLNAITDVGNVHVGHTTLISGEGELRVGKGPVRTGVTAILPRGENSEPVFAGCYALNGNGEMTGTTWVEESGFLEGPVMMTNTHSVGAVHESVVAWLYEQKQKRADSSDFFWILPVVAETYDGRLNDINGFHVKREHVFAALDRASAGPVAEGNVGGGTGMICHEFKGGIGTASRIVDVAEDVNTVGVLVQANYGSRRNLTIGEVPMGSEITDLRPEVYSMGERSGGSSIIVVVATDAPLLPHQLKRLARRVPLGIARVGGVGAHNSGDSFIAFSTANAGAGRDNISEIQMLANDRMTPLFEATIFATEEAIVNAMVAAETMIGINGNTAHALPHDRVVDVLRVYRRLLG